MSISVLWRFDNISWNPSSWSWQTKYCKFWSCLLNHQRKRREVGWIAEWMCLHLIKPIHHNIIIFSRTLFPFAQLLEWKNADNNRPDCYFRNLFQVWDFNFWHFSRKFSIESTSKKAVLVLRKTLDYDGGERLFNITIRAQVNHS